MSVYEKQKLNNGHHHWIILEDGKPMDGIHTSLRSVDMALARLENKDGKEGQDKPKAKSPVLKEKS